MSANRAFQIEQSQQPFRNLLWLVRETRKYSVLQAAVFACLVSSELLVFVDPLILRRIIDSLANGYQLRGTATLCALLLACSIARATSFSCGSYFSLIVDARLLLDLRMQVMQRLTARQPAYHWNTSQGRKMYLLNDCVQEVVRLGTEGLHTIVTAVIGLSFATVLVYRLDPHLALLLLPVALASAAAAKSFGVRVKRFAERDEAQRIAAHEVCEEQVGSALQVQLLGAERMQQRVLKQVWNGVNKYSLRRHRTELENQVIANVLASVIVILIFGYGSYQVHAGLLSLGTLVAFYGCAFRLVEPLLRLVTTASNIKVVTVHLKTLRDFIEERDALYTTGQRTPARVTGIEGSYALVARNVTFKIPDSTLTCSLPEVSLAHGEHVAICGPSGAGKTTILRLLGGLLKPECGTLALEGAAFADIDWTVLRASVIVVSQDVVLFDASVKENILLDDETLSEESLSLACRSVGLNQMFFENKDVGPNGGRLSSGEKQRLAIARALVRSPIVLALDEATNAIDLESEAEIFAEIRRNYPQLLVLAVTHRTTQLDWANRVFHVSDGRWGRAV